MKLIRMALALAILLAAGLAGPATAQKENYELKLALEEGDQFDTTITTKQEIRQEMMGQSLSRVQNMTMEITQTVTSVDEAGNMDVVFHFDRVVIESGEPGKLETIDTDNLPESPTPEMLIPATMEGNSITVTYTPQYAVEKVEGMDELIETALDAMPVEESVKEQMRDVFKSQFSNQAFSNNLKQTTPVFPSSPVSQGESWNDEVRIKRGFPMVVEKTLTLKEAGAESLTLDYRASVSPNPEGEPISVGPMELDLKLSGTQEGEFLFDRQKGFIKSGKTDQDFNGNAIMDQAGQQMKLPMQISSSMEIKSTEKTSD